MTEPLTGLRVAEHGEDLAAAFCGRYLAGLGARVGIAGTRRFERLGPHHPDGRSFVALYVDHGKYVDDKIDDLDVVLNADLAIPRGPAESGLIRVGFSDFGTSGPQSDRRGGELVAQADAGLLSLVGDSDGPPLRLGGHQIDYSMGLMAFTAVMIALWARDREGQGGQDIALSRLEAVAYIEWKGRIYTQVGSPLERGQMAGPTVVEVKDGWFGLYYRPGDWPALLEVLDDERLRAERFVTAPGRDSHQGELDEIFADVLRSWTRDELYAALHGAGVPVAPVLTPAELINSPQYRHRGFMEARPDLGASACQPAIPVVINGLRPRPPLTPGVHRNK